MPGVVKASVDLATEAASLRSTPGIGLADLRAAVEKSGYTVGESSVTLAIDGMACATCVSRGEKVLLRVPSVVPAEAGSEFSGADLAQCRDCVAPTGQQRSHRERPGKQKTP